MTWLAAAVGGHLLNATAFIIDKTLLTAAFRQSGTYATVIGLLSSLAFVLLPWVDTTPGTETWLAVAAFGGGFILALWAFFEALARAEASRVVPIVGSLIPVFTFFMSAVVVHERLAPRTLLGLAFLLAATVLLTRGGGTRHLIDTRTLFICIGASLLFASSSTLGKFAFEREGFLNVFVLSRVFAAIVAASIPIVSPAVRKELGHLFRPKKRGEGPTVGHAALMVFGQTCGGAGFVGVQYAISLGSATVVNALQAVQYAAIVLVAWLGGKKLSALLNEEHTPRVLQIKTFAIVLVAVGLALVGLPVA